MAVGSATLQDRLERWSERLNNLTVSPLARDYDAQADSKRAIEAFETVKLSRDTQSALQKLCGPTSSQFTVFLTAFVLLVARLTGDEDIAIATNLAEDSRPFVLRVFYDPAESFTQLLAKVQKIFDECASDIVPLGSLRSYIKDKSKSERTPVLFRFAAYDAPAESQEYPANTFDSTDLVINIANELGAYYNQRLFSSARIATILRQLVQIADNAAANPDQAVGRIDMLTEEQRALLPDPTANLNWSKFRGAIHDIFAENAQRHPEKLCVVETKSSTSPQREFTYQQINEASNILGHHLVQAGIERGDVVMVYAYRGVDLVVAVMGILKAGATFSVIDPAYPPERQNIYLDVARPRALINIAKATADAGELSDIVRTFINENLELRTEIPALALHDDGTLTGGVKGGQDVFAKQIDLKSQSVGVVVGPDSIPTLSFTSGSEGRPKGVRGRHFSLAYYFPWMSETFKLSEQDKFSMLSGIAHDPIQRDIFTPLFLGAQLLVPAKEDIQNEKLAEWMRDYGATVTHLTPAMGQILVGGASAQFPALHHAFFVGDILIKRDCRSLQGLAPNVSIVNMYGTTETQRAVSYYEIPSYSSQEGFLDTMKDIIPAGRGMVDVQMLVVNPFDPTRMCAIGEVGEVYVRAAGLAEGYLGSPEMNAKKFLTNWFVKPDHWTQKDTGGDEPWRQFYVGPRDRLYRSGDLGRYTPSGDVEVSGRIDSQVKIRGFRIELGEIDTHLSRHPLVRENVTLVRRDKFEEPTLVSYFVPDMNKWSQWLQAKGLEDDDSGEGMVGMLRRFLPLRNDTRDFLRSKLPAYAVPTVIIPLKRMPLNPNGKIDKPALPFPDTAELSAAAPRRRSSAMQAFSETEQALAQIWAKLIPNVTARMIGSDDSFFDLGGHSILAQQMFFELRRKWRTVDISMSAIFRSPTLKAFAGEIDRLLDAEAFATSDTTEPSNSGPDDDYSKDARQLVKELPASFPTRTEELLASPPTVFLTGATGFLGAHILRDLLTRKSPSTRVVALVRAKGEEQALARLRSTCQAYGFWDDEWVNRLETPCGDLGKPLFGLSQLAWDDLAGRVDVVIHNGALVHWVYPYSTLRGPNVLGTIDALKLCATGKAKHFAFVSSTSALDNDHYVQVSERSLAEGGKGVSEDDDMEGSAVGLGTGYGQSKWAGEHLVRAARSRGLKAGIIRSGYILGDSTSGVCVTDDFLTRFWKGCVQLGSRPNIGNSVNACPSDYVVRVVISAAFYPPANKTGVVHVTGQPRLRFNEFLGALETYGYPIKQIDYIPWASSLEHYVNDGQHDDKESQHALMPLYHFVVSDLPSNSKAPELDNTWASAGLKTDTAWSGVDASAGAGITVELIGLYASYLVAIGFLPAPTVDGARPLPPVPITEEQKRMILNVGGRGGAP
ncbi:L-aminoadipate-semialdehyde dehydrogenase large subunit [Penicillium ucsense]|uniref:Alpha-aminoadipate reductase n=1 Tax=Penicillium ucsense TaxID=2839758 RepID=A0A8J8W599_9EURO|nr:L-aminoadipate-semialdehyde dehydrogenase large subunit [Penicillium ucsense]KAF7736869.1 L-aminoadipate-semialdehyde dehydrogenase large subunit [Penicillium ucsense]